MKILARSSIFTLFTIILLSLLVISCEPEYVHSKPVQNDDGWETASLQEVGMDEDILKNLINNINRGKYQNIDSILIVKDNKLVFEEYFSGFEFDYFGELFHGDPVAYDRDRTHNLASVTKAFTSAVVGIAIDKGYIRGVDEKVMSYFPEYSYLNNDTKDKITIAHLLTMTSGLEWNEGDVPLTDTEKNDLIQLFIVDDPIEYILSKSVVTEPGEHFYYSGGDVNLLGEIVRRASGLRIDSFAEKYLFTPLGITEYEWKYLNNDIVYTSGDLAVCPRDMAKLGLLYLNNGIWNDNQIISAEWTQSSINNNIPITNTFMSKTYGDRYGYQWFLQKFEVEGETIDSLERDGWGGQRIQVFPSLDTVVVLTGGNYATAETPVNEILTNFILPALN